MAILTKQDVFSAANELAAQGEMPSIIEVRKILGRGSESTIHKYLKEWKQNLLSKNNDGCVFCKSMELERDELTQKLNRYSLAIVGVQNMLLNMLKSSCQNELIEQMRGSLQ